MTPPAAAGVSVPRHLVLATIEDGLRALSIRVLGAFAESLSLRVTLLYIIKPLAVAGHPVEFTPGEVRQLADWLKREQVTHLGFYLMTASLKPCQQLVRALREAGFAGTVLTGGVHVTLRPEESLVEGADFAVQGPGELPLKLLFEGADPAAIPGLVWRRDGAVQVNPPSGAQKLDLDLLPFPIFRFDQDRVLLEGRLRPLTRRLFQRYASWNGRYYETITSRGCLYGCAYCCHVDRGAIRRAGVDRVIRELKSVRERHPQIAGVNIQDDVFFAGSDEWIAEFCRRMPAEVGLPFIVRMIPRFVTEERVALLRAAGLEYVTMGLEGSNRVNRVLYRRPEDAKSFLQAARTVLEAGLHLSIDVIIDNPYENEDDLREVARTLNALPRPGWGVVALSLTLFPGTALYERCAADGMLERFATDPYDAMLMPSKEGGYRTPAFWRQLYLILLPAISADLGEQLITAGPRNPRAAQIVERLAARMERAQRITGWLQRRVPWLYGLLGRGLGLVGRRS